MNTSSLSQFPLYFRVAEATFCVTFPSAAAAEDLSASYAPFRISAKEAISPLFHLTVGIEAPAETAPSTAIGSFDCGGALHRVFHHPSIDGYRMSISTVDGQLACTLEATAHFQTVNVFLSGDAEARSFGLNNALMIAFAFAGAYRHIVLMHASVVLLDDKGYMFLGKSGTGKSTHSRLWLQTFPGAELLNDDNPAVRWDEETGVVTVYGTPWSGKTPCYRNLSAPVGAVVRLEQAPENRIRRLPRLEAFASILSSCSTMIWDRASYDAIIATSTAVATHTPIYYLSCLPDEEAALLCHRTLHDADAAQ
jgi:hypothetical protein